MKQKKVAETKSKDGSSPTTSRQRLTKDGDGHWPGNGGVCASGAVPHGAAVDGDGGFYVGVVNKAVDMLVLKKEKTRVGQGGDGKRNEQVTVLVPVTQCGRRPYLCHAGQNNEA